MAKCLATTLIQVAEGEIGYREKKSNSQLDEFTANAGSNNWTKYARDFDQKYPNWYNGKKNGFEWCDMFVDWCFLTAFGYEEALRLLCQPEKSCGAGCTYSRRYYANKGQFHASNPQVGDQIFFRSDITSTSDECTHTGIVYKVDEAAGIVYTIEGNASDQVKKLSYSLGSKKIVGYGRPAYDDPRFVQASTNSGLAAAPSMVPTTDPDVAEGKAIYEKLNAYTRTMSVPAGVRDEWQECIDLGLTDGSNPCQMVPAWRAFIVALRAYKKSLK